MSRHRALPDPDAASIAELIDLSNRFGVDPMYSRAGGGNASVKADGVLWIKPSGVPLATLTAGDLVPLDLPTLLAVLDDAPLNADPDTDPVMTAAADARLDAASGRRPSVELLFHALLSERYVLHTHPIAVNAITCHADGAELAARLFGDRVLWVPYTDPGLPLARAILGARAAYETRVGRPAPAITLLGNHGLIVAGASAAAIDAETAWLASVIDGALQAAPAPREWQAPADAELTTAAMAVIGPVLRARLGGVRRGVVLFDDDPLAASFAGTAVGRAFAAGGALIPDHIVYAGVVPLLLDVAGVAPDALAGLVIEQLGAFAAEHGDLPIVALVPGVGLFASGESWAQADTARHIALDMLRTGALAIRLGGVRHLAGAERGFIEQWEAEAYRKQIALGEGSGGRIAGRVALVTGAAQGFGLGIAEGLLAHGAHVVLADLNVPLAEREAARLCAQHGEGRAIAVAMDVTDEASVAAGVAEVVRRFGGFDLVVSNAGVLRAGAVTAQPVDEFDLVTRVNYRGYWLVVKHTAPVLALQHAADDAWWGDIVEISSKSGLVGSSRNSAYAGSKFGGIGLTQSFALELVGDGIKVNAVCPGNFFDGPLWSDPVNGLFVQYLREGKVPGAQSVDDVRRAYEAKVPMGRGCLPADIVEAILYLVAQQYETGQALPVTGGQVMLS